MKDVIEIGISIEDIAVRRDRVETARRFGTPDRVPVLPAIAHRFLVPLTGTRFRDYYRDPEVMLRTQILGQKWLMENVRTDAYGITGPWVGAWTDFQNTFEAGSLGCEIVFPEDDIPWVGPGWVRDEADLTRLAAMEYVHEGMNARQIDFRRRMIEAAERYPVRFKGGEIFYPGAAPSLTHTSDGPFGVAGDLMGNTELFLACAERPDFVRELLGIIAEKMIDWLDFCWAEEPLPHPKDFAWTDDLAVSPDMFREIVLPSNKRLRDHFDGRLSLHMCGKSDHLLDIFRDDLRIDELQGFGWEVNLDRIAAAMSGRVVLLGNIDPRLILQGTPAEVIEATRRVIEKLGPGLGFIIQDGNNIPPGSPLPNINAMMDAAERFGRYD
jgi:uroporphyrinogen decarboxylase